MTDEWYENLKSMPFTSKKAGKMLNLLKASAKPINQNKRRKVIPLLGKIGDFHKAREDNVTQSKQKSQNFGLNFNIGSALNNDDEDSQMSQKGQF